MQNIKQKLAKVRHLGLKGVAERVTNKLPNSRGLQASLLEKKILAEAEELIKKGKYADAIKRYLALPESLREKQLYRIGKAYLKTGEPAYAIEYLEAMPAKKKDNTHYHITLASALEQDGRYLVAARLLEAATERAFFEELNSQKKAAWLYRVYSNYYQAGDETSADRCLEKAAAYGYEREVAKYGRGILHYRMKQWVRAADLLKGAAQTHKDDAKFLSIVGRTLAYVGRVDEAIKYYEKSLAIDWSNSGRHKEVAELHWQAGNAQAGIEHYKAASARENYSADTYSRLQALLVEAGLSDEAKQTIKIMKLNMGSAMVPKQVSADHKSSKFNRYSTYYEHLAVDNQIIFYESMSGDKIADNPLALFESALHDSRLKEFTHVWSLGSMENAPKEYLAMKNVIFVKRSSDIYLRYLATAKYLICNSKLPGYFIRKPDQLYLNTWHGTAYKRLGTDTSEAIVGENNTARNFLQATHIITPNEHMTNVQQDAYHIRHLYSGTIAETGYPRIDMTLAMTKSDKGQLVRDLDLDENKKTVLYAPTWRSGNKFDTARLQVDLAALAGLGVNVVFMGHHITQRQLKGVAGLDEVVFTGPLINSNRILAVADVLLTDYSSIFYDFLVTDKPIVHYLYDIKKYKKKRGLYFEEKTLPGEVVYTSDELVDAVQHTLQKEYRLSARYAKAKEQFVAYDDGKASQRVIDWFFFGNEKDVNIVSKEKVKRRLFVAGQIRTTDDIAVKDLAMLKKTGKWQNYILAPSSSPIYKDREVMMHELTKYATPLGYVANNGQTLHEMMDGASTSHIRRDYRRVFSNTMFDEVINLDRQSDYWAEFARCGK